MSDKNDPFERFSSDTLRRADELCSGLEVGLSLDRRGRAMLYPGAVTDLEDQNAGHVSVTVAEVDHDPGFTLIADAPLLACRRALLVFRRPPGEDARYIGHFGVSKPGNRSESDRDKHVVQFTIDQSVPRR